jgi:hypothetical protein
VKWFTPTTAASAVAEHNSVLSKESCAFRSKRARGSGRQGLASRIPYFALVAQQGEVGDGLAGVGEHQRHVQWSATPGPACWPIAPMPPPKLVVSADGQGHFRLSHQDPDVTASETITLGF